MILYSETYVRMSVSGRLLVHSRASSAYVVINSFPASGLILYDEDVAYWPDFTETGDTYVPKVITTADIATKNYSRFVMVMTAVPATNYEINFSFDNDATNRKIIISLNQFFYFS